MKYLKITVLLFAVATLLSALGVNAQTTALIDVTIPVFKGTYYSNQADKLTLGYQKIMKTDAKDDLTGDGRAISGRIMKLTVSGGFSDWKQLPKNVLVQYDQFKEYGIFEIALQSDKSLPMTASFWGIWDLGSDLQ